MSRRYAVGVYEGVGVQCDALSWVVRCAGCLGDVDLTSAFLNSCKPCVMLAGIHCVSTVDWWWAYGEARRSWHCLAVLVLQSWRNVARELADKHLALTRKRRAPLGRVVSVTAVPWQVSWTPAVAAASCHSPLSPWQGGCSGDDVA